MYHLPQSSPLPPLEPRRTYGGPLTTSYRPERPAGVTILALLNFGYAALSLFLVARVLLSSRVPFSPGYEMVPGFPQLLLIASSGGAMFIGIAGTAISLPLAIGLWRLRPWGRIMALIVYIGGVVVTLCAHFSSPITGSTLISLAIGVGAAIYLLQPEADKAFGELPTS